jgi:hypothetical protein
MQRLLIALIEKLAEHPAQLGDYQTMDSNGRILHVLRTGKFVLVYWPDDPTKDLRIVEIALL